MIQGRGPRTTSCSHRNRTSFLEFLRTDGQRMDTAPQPRELNRLSAGWLAVVIVVLLPVGYVLSVGPMARLADNHRMSISTWQAFYLPLLVAGDHCSPVDKAMGWYVGCWVQTISTFPTGVRKTFHQIADYLGCIRSESRH